jgi:putative colanic acid biosynthesis UDP-glucose lipid carrier transferase
MENVRLSVFRSSAAVDGTESWGTEELSVLADQGEMDRSRVVSAESRRRPAALNLSYPVATHPLKRLLDVSLAGFALLLFLPLLLVVMMVIRLESPGSSIFRQRRTGYRGKVFTIYKFRTMTVTEDCAKVRQATKGDERVTEVGALLRKLSIDELPQLWNVLKGDMSIVGPRPHALAHDEYYGALIPTYAARFRAKPGLTGYAQVNGFRGEIRDTRCMSDRVAADNAYIEEWSPALDLAILIKTVPLIFHDPRAY